MIKRLGQYPLEVRIKGVLRRLGFRWWEFKYNPYRKIWIVEDRDVGRDFPECLDNLRILEKKRNDIR